ncbi:hypothetical protein AK37_16765 [Rhodococcus pyridinivorans AK37]|uniref:Uncharacterized protein n=1 Tax=Rhodococcus pyridinivorans AK37 TaxID=1114960 RepID=H0JUH9_9NOCA|nr:hypothetical protein AK37_16765 [Rhodococcus pyridinivorans AK37]
MAGLIAIGRPVLPTGRLGSTERHTNKEDRSLMISSLVIRPLARAIAVVLIVADTALATRVPALPDWDEDGSAARS